MYDPALPGYVVNLSATVDPTNGTAGFVGLQGIVWNQADYEEAPFVALGLNLMADTSLGADLSGCNALSYRYKGAQHVIKVQDGSVTDYAYHQLKMDSSSVWTEAIVPFEKLEQPVWTKAPKDMNFAFVKKIAWEVIGYKNFDMQPAIPYLYVDDLKCVNATVGIKTIARATTGLKLSAQGADLSIMTTKSGLVKVQVFDLTGHSVKSVSENMQAGAHTVSLENLTAGSYIVRVQAGSAVKSARITLK